MGSKRSHVNLSQILQTFNGAPETAHPPGLLCTITRSQREVTSCLHYQLGRLTQMLEAPVTAQDEVAGEEHREAPDTALLYGGVALDPAYAERGRPCG